MTSELPVKEQVRQYYEQIGWRSVGGGLYQNARYEDLRPVSEDYRRRSHRRVARHLPSAGEYLLDAGSGPIQYPEYLEYSAGYRYRVCLDISRRALVAARDRLGPAGLCVVGDVAHPPFAGAVFAGLVSLHTIHHLLPDEHEPALRGFYRTLRPGGKGVVVYSWGARSGLMRLAAPLLWLAGVVRRAVRSGRGPALAAEDGAAPDLGALGQAPANAASQDELNPEAELIHRPGTFTFRHDFEWFRQTLGDLPGFDIRVWRSVSVHFLRSLVHPKLLGGQQLQVLAWLEERLPRWLGRHGQYPMILFQKPQSAEGESSR